MGYLDIPKVVVDGKGGQKEVNNGVILVKEQEQQQQQQQQQQKNIEVLTIDDNSEVTQGEEIEEYYKEFEKREVKFLGANFFNKLPFVILRFV